MGKQATTKSGRYLYAVMSVSEERTYGSIGIDGGTVYTISKDGVAAVVSDVSNEKIRPERRHLAAHQQVLRRLMEETTVLPMSFGIIADGSKAIKGILSHSREAFIPELHRIADKVEMGLRVTWDVPNIFEYFVNAHPELKAARDRFLGTHREPTQEEKIELGRMFERLLSEDRDMHTSKVHGVLSRFCFDIKENKCRNEREVMNLACLMGRGSLKQFEAGIFEAAGLFDNTFAFDYNGPWAPHNFVKIDIKF